MIKKQIYFIIKHFFTLLGALFLYFALNISLSDKEKNFIGTNKRFEINTTNIHKYIRE